MTKQKRWLTQHSANTRPAHQGLEGKVFIDEWPCEEWERVTRFMLRPFPCIFTPKIGEQTMLAEEARSIRNGLGVLAGRISEEDWHVVEVARKNLEALAVQLRAFEQKPVAVDTEEGK